MTNQSGPPTYTVLGITSGPPTEGDYAAGAALIDPDGPKLWVCQQPGNPGLWASIGLNNGAVSPGANFRILTRARLATTSFLPSNTYSNGVLTGITNGALLVDSTNVATGDRIVVKDEGSDPSDGTAAPPSPNNGVYDVVQPGSSTTPYILRRSTDMDTSAELGGVYVFVSQGATNANTAWTTAAGTYVLGTDNVTFDQAGGSASYIGNAPVTVSGNSIGVAVGFSDGTVAAGDDPRFGQPVAPLAHSPSQYPGVSGQGGTGPDPIPQAAFTSQPSFSPRPDTAEGLFPSSWTDIAEVALGTTDQNILRYGAYDLRADCPVLNGVTFYIKTAATGGGAVTTPIAGTDSSTFEGGVGSWVNHTNATVTSSTDKAQAGTHSLKIVSTAGGNTKASLGGTAGALNNRLPCTAGDTIAVGIYGSAGATGRSGCKIDMAFYDSGFNFISQSNGSGTGNITDTTSGWTQATQNFTAPANATSYRLIWELSSGSVAAGEAHYIDTVTITRTASGGASAAQFRVGLWAADATGQAPTGTPLAVTAAIDASVLGDQNALFTTPFDPAGVPRRVFVGLVYQYSSAPGTHPTIVRCTVPSYVRLTSGQVPAGGIPRISTQSAVSGSLSAVTAAPDGTATQPYFVGLTTGASTPPSTGQISFGLTRKIGGGGATPTKDTYTALENLAGFGRAHKGSRQYRTWAQSTSFPTADDLAYLNMTNLAHTGRDMLLTISMSDDVTTVGVPNWRNVSLATGPSATDGAGHSLASLYADAVRWGNKLAGLAASAPNSTIYVTLQHEPDAKTHSANLPSDYILAWRNFHDIVSAIAPNVKWLWNLTAFAFQEGTATSFYPGDAYVHAIGADGYNWGSNRGFGAWRSFSDIYAGFLTFAATTGSTIELFLPEYGCVKQDAKDATKTWSLWMADMLVQIKKPAWSRLKGVFYWSNHDNKFAKNPDGSTDFSTFEFPLVDWTWMYTAYTVPASPSTTLDPTTIAAMLAFASDSVFAA